MLDEVLTIRLLTTTTTLPTIEFSAADAQSDERLAEAVLSGDEHAFAELFERHKRHVTRVVSRFFRDRSEVEEFVQQSFTKAYFSLSGFRGGQQHSMAAWLTRISVNICYDEFRRRQRRSESLFTEMSDDENSYLETLEDGRQPSPEHSVAAAHLVEKIMSGLDPNDRIAMTLVYSENYTLTEAADAIGITSSNLKSRLFRCRGQLKARFGHLFK
ncbi:MAG: RNA polymerase sigma factor [Acidobacteriota bacterium]